MLTRRKVILAKIETTPGTPETLSTSDNPILVKDLRVTPRVNMYERGLVLNTISHLGGVPGGRLMTVSFTTEVKGPEEAYTSSKFPAIKDYLRACGFSASFSGGSGSEKYEFDPISDNIPALTIGIYEDGLVHKMTGARGTVSFSGTVGEPVLATFEFTGIWVGTTSQTMPAPTFDLRVPPTCVNGEISIDGTFTPIISKFSIDMACTLEPRPNIAADQGYDVVLLTRREPKGQIDPEGVLPNVYDFYGKWRDGEPLEIEIQIGTTQYNRMKFSMPRCMISEITEDDRNGILVYTVNFAVTVASASEQELKITFD